MARGEVHPACQIDNRTLQRLGKINQARETCRRSRRAVGQDHWILRCYEKARHFGHGT
jgi:hypothetical protein